jgi:hypothetical protein
MRIAVIPFLLHGAVAVAQPCTGDCPPANQQVAINELVLGVNIALGNATLPVCPSYDANVNGAVDIDELITAVNNAQRGCAGGPTPTARPTSPGSTPTAPGATPTVTPTATWTVAPGPRITYFGVTSADDSPQDPLNTEGIPIYQRLVGSGFKLVVEANAQAAPGSETYIPGGTPDLQVQATRDLGNGSAAVCDVVPPDLGGVPGIDPPQLENPDGIADALNDLGCRFLDGVGNPTGRSCGEACVRFDDGEYHCMREETAVQFCAQISAPIEFPAGDTLVTARVRSPSGQLGPAEQLIIRVTPP